MFNLATSRIKKRYRYTKRKQLPFAIKDYEYFEVRKEHKHRHTKIRSKIEVDFDVGGGCWVIRSIPRCHGKNFYFDRLSRVLESVFNEQE